MGRLPTTGQGHVGSAPRPAKPRRAAGLPLHQVARPRGSRRRLARDVHNLEVNTEQRAWGSARPLRPALRPGGARIIHRLTYRRTNHSNLHVRGYKEEGTTTTPFDMCVLNDLDRFHLVADVIDRVPQLGARAAYAKQVIRDKLIEHKHYIAEHGEDMPEINNWTWGQDGGSAGGHTSTEADNV